MIILGVILLIIGFLTGVAVIWTIGIIVVIAGAIPALLGDGPPLGRRPQALLLSNVTRLRMLASAGDCQDSAAPAEAVRA